MCLSLNKAQRQNNPPPRKQFAFTTRKNFSNQYRSVHLICNFKKLYLKQNARSEENKTIRKTAPGLPSAPRCTKSMKNYPRCSSYFLNPNHPGIFQEIHRHCTLFYNPPVLDNTNNPSGKKKNGSLDSLLNNKKTQAVRVLLFNPKGCSRKEMHHYTRRLDTISRKFGCVRTAKRSRSTRNLGLWPTESRLPGIASDSRMNRRGETTICSGAGIGTWDSTITSYQENA